MLFFVYWFNEIYYKNLYISLFKVYVLNVLDFIVFIKNGFVVNVLWMFNEYLLWLGIESWW